MADEQLRLFDLGPRRPLKTRYADIVTIRRRCCNCGTEWSFWWGTWNHRSVCGDCWGIDRNEADHQRQMHVTSN